MCNQRYRDADSQHQYYNIYYRIGKIKRTRGYTCKRNNNKRHNCPVDKTEQYTCQDLAFDKLVNEWIEQEQRHRKNKGDKVMK